MKLIKLLATAATATLFLSGCSQHVYTADGGCLTCFNNPVTGEPINHDGTAKAKGKESAGSPKNNSGTNFHGTGTYAYKGNFEIATSIDIDLVAIKIKQAFGYRSLDELMSRSNGWISGSRKDFHAYEQMPGIYYRFSDELGYGVVATELEKDGKGGTLIKVIFRTKLTDSKAQQKHKGKLINKINLKLGL